MADAKTDIVVHNGNIVVMNGNIIMGPCEPAWELKINGMSFYEFNKKIQDEKAIQFVDSLGVEAKYMPLDGSFADDGSVTNYPYYDYSYNYDFNAGEWIAKPLGFHEWKLSSPQPIGIDGFVWYLMGENDRPSRINNLQYYDKPREGRFLMDTNIWFSTDYVHTYSGYGSNPAFTDEGRAAKSFDAFFEFEIEATEDGGFVVSSQGMLSSAEAYEKYNEVFAYMQQDYRFWGGIGGGGAYYKGTFDMDITITVEKKTGGDNGNQS